jgi:hypothetical protein
MARSLRSTLSSSTPGVDTTNIGGMIILAKRLAHWTRAVFSAKQPGPLWTITPGNAPAGRVDVGQ